MNILFTNDDGIHTYGITALAKEAARRGHRAIIVAPSEQRSANSHYITLHDPVLIQPLQDADFESYAVDGTPADCARIALLNLFPKDIDMVISGINDGWNAGRAILYSGTCGAAREAVICGKKAIASSINFHADHAMIDYAAAFTIDMAERLHRSEIQTKDAFLNINVPALPTAQIKEPKMAFISAVTPKDHYVEFISPRKQRYFFIGNDYAMEQGTPGSDVQLLNEGHITLSFLSIAEDAEILEPRFLERA